MVGAGRRDLCEMSNAQDLATGGDGLQMMRHRGCDTPANAGIDLVINQGWHLRAAGGRDLNRETRAREFAARCDLA